jgi:hypothetical protein
VFHETVCSDIRIFYKGVREFLTVFPIFIDPLAYNLVQKPPPNTDGQFWFHESRYSVRSAVLTGLNGIWTSVLYCFSEFDTFHSGGFSHDDIR